jgi:hypothetical protein
MNSTIARAIVSSTFLVVAIWLSLLHAETRVPTYVPPDICDLTVTADRETGDVAIAWSGGIAPFIVVRSETQELRLSNRLEVVGWDLRSTLFVDRRAYRADRRFYYQVYDRNSQPEIFGFSPDGGLPGAEIRVRGVGFRSDCAKITVQAGGREVPTKLDCGFLGFTFKVPIDSMTGFLIVATPAGVALAGDVGEETRPMCKGAPRRPRSW